MSSYLLGCSHIFSIELIQEHLLFLYSIFLQTKLPESEPLLEIEPEESEELYTPKSIDEIEEGLKIKWTSEDGKVLDGHIDIIDKMMKKNINIIIYDEGEIKLKVPLSDIKVIRYLPMIIFNIKYQQY